GEYSFEFALVDKRFRTFRSHWNVKTDSGKNRGVPLALKPNSVAPLVGNDWNGKLSSDGVRLAVLLHAIPMFRNTSKLYAWDRAFLLQSLASLLKQTPCKSIRVIAFNLDQQRELFRSDDFGPDGFVDLAEVLRKTEMATVSYKSLQKKTWAELLVG